MASLADHPLRALELVELINAYRASKGVQPLKVDHTLMDLAQDYTNFLDATGQFSHTADGQYPWDRIRKSGFEYEEGLTGSRIGNENLHYGYSSKDGYNDPQEALEGWMNSGGHNRNMLNPEWDRIGVGYRDGIYTGLFGDGPDEGSGSPTPNPTPTPTPTPTPPPPSVTGGFGGGKTVTFTADKPADYAVVTLTGINDANGSSGTVRFDLYMGDKKVGSGSAAVREGTTANVKVDAPFAFDRIVVSAGESDVTGVASKAAFTPLSQPTSAAGGDRSFGPSDTVSFITDELADYVKVKIGNLVDANGSRATVTLEALNDGRTVAKASVGLPEPGATVRFDPRADFDEIRITAGESDVTGTVLALASDADGWIIA